jgi:methylase of polypeptide subunit release factors
VNPAGEKTAPDGRTWGEPFGALEIEVDEGVLRPRPWTLLQSHWARDLLDGLPPGDVLELCTGAGQIGLAAVHGTGRRLVAVDAEAHACELARRNARQVREEVDVREGRFDAALDPDERFVLALADPPWVPTQRVEDHPEDPTWAIDGGIDGLEVARRCVRVAARHLVPGGRLLLQLGTRHQVDVIGHTCETSGVEVLEVREGGEDGSRGVVALLSLGRPQEGDAVAGG